MQHCAKNVHCQTLIWKHSACVSLASWKLQVTNWLHFCVLWRRNLFTLSVAWCMCKVFEIIQSEMMRGMTQYDTFSSQLCPGVRCKTVPTSDRYGGTQCLHSVCQTGRTKGQTAVYLGCCQSDVGTLHAQAAFSPQRSTICRIMPSASHYTPFSRTSTTVTGQASPNTPLQSVL